MFIRGVDGITVQTKSKKDGLTVKNTFKKGHDRNTPSCTLRYRGFSKSGFHGFGSGLVAIAFDWGHVGLPSVVRGNFYFYTF
mgnify:CR=1 FL=1